MSTLARAERGIPCGIPEPLWTESSIGSTASDPQLRFHSFGSTVLDRAKGSLSAPGSRYSTLTRAAARLLRWFLTVDQAFEASQGNR